MTNFYCRMSGEQVLNSSSGADSTMNRVGLSGPIRVGTPSSSMPQNPGLSGPIRVGTPGVSMPQTSSTVMLGSDPIAALSNATNIAALNSQFGKLFTQSSIYETPQFICGLQS